jgi:hypothetical protein
MTSRERLQAVLNFKPFDRLPVMEWAGWWDKTLDRWHQEGLDPAMTDRQQIYRTLGMDVNYQDWINIYRPTMPSFNRQHGGGVLEAHGGYDEIRKHLYPESPVDQKRWREWAAIQARGEASLWFTLDGFFWFPRRLMGIENHLFAFYDEPELMHRINQDLVDWCLKAIDELTQICVPDFMTIAEDLSYNHGPMLSKELFDEFLAPYYRQIVPALKKRGIPVIVDSDGDVTEPAYWFESVGVDGILPLERQAGVDIARLRAEHPRMRFIGHFDKMTMNKGEAAMRAEFERVLPTAARGGFVVSCDHQTPPGVSFREYQLYLALFREYGEEAGRLSRQYLA